MAFEELFGVALIGDLSTAILLIQTLRKGTYTMDRALPFLISAGIAAFGAWIVVHATVSGSSFVWALLGILPLVVGSISLYQAIVEN